MIAKQKIVFISSLLQRKNKNYFNTKCELNVKVNSLLTFFCG